MTTPDTLVAAPEDEDAEPLDSWEGAGFVSSIADLHDAVVSDHPDPFEIGYSAAAAGLDTLDAAMHPLDSLLQAGIGWLIEHVAFLHEPLDALCGDPTQITAQAQTWHNVARELAEVATGHRASAGVPGWEGAAADAYRRTVEGFAAALDDTAGNAERLSGLILLSGAGVGTERALIRDRIAEFLARLIEFALLCALSAVITAGGSVATFVVGAVIQALDLARKIAHRVSQLLDVLQEAGGTAAQLSGAVRDTTAQVRAAAPGLHAAGRSVLDTAGSVHTGSFVEAGKQTSGANHDRRGWDEGPALIRD